MKRDRLEAKEKGLSQPELDDEDYIEFQNAINEDKAHDSALLLAEGGEDEE